MKLVFNVTDIQNSLSIVKAVCDIKELQIPSEFKQKIIWLIEEHDAATGTFAPELILTISEVNSIMNPEHISIQVIGDEIVYWIDSTLVKEQYSLLVEWCSEIIALVTPVVMMLKALMPLLKMRGKKLMHDVKHLEDKWKRPAAETPAAE